MSDCTHWRTQGRPGERGSWCFDCGVKVWQPHDRPCGECKNFSAEVGRAGICSRRLMRVTSDMFVTYKIGAPTTGDGLCFEPR